MTKPRISWHLGFILEVIDVDFVWYHGRYCEADMKTSLSSAYQQKRSLLIVVPSPMHESACTEIIIVLADICTIQLDIAHVFHELYIHCSVCDLFAVISESFSPICFVIVRRHSLVIGCVARLLTIVGSMNGYYLHVESRVIGHGR
jgi:hypothetical protein